MTDGVDRGHLINIESPRCLLQCSLHWMTDLVAISRNVSLIVLIKLGGDMFSDCIFLPFIKTVHLFVSLLYCSLNLPRLVTARRIVSLCLYIKRKLVYYFDSSSLYFPEHSMPR